MKILILSNVPSTFEVYDRSLTSKILGALKKNIKTDHVFFLLKGSERGSHTGFIVHELPVKWKSFNKLFGMTFIFLKNIKEIRKSDADLVWIELGNGMSEFSMVLYPLIFPQKKFYVETSTPSVDRSKVKRKIHDFCSTVVLKTYRNIGVGNPSCKEAFKIAPYKILRPRIGFPSYGFNEKTFECIKLVYLGTLDNRDVWKTVVGLKYFIDKNPGKTITYDIIGAGYPEDIRMVKDAITENCLDSIVHYHGFQPTEFVEAIFNKCNIGVAFVPIVEYYNTVSTTKALEYLLAGMPMIATRTSFAESIYKEEAGVLCNDSPEDFARALDEISNKTANYNSNRIKELYQEYEMNYAISNFYVPMLEKIV